MNLYANAFKLLKESIVSNDLGILFIAIIALCLYFMLLGANRVIKKDRSNGRYSENSVYHFLNITYSLFITIISIFPLLGMFGTVCGLLGLDLATGDMENIKNNFFVALTSTAWGIIFSILSWG